MAGFIPRRWHSHPRFLPGLVGWCRRRKGIGERPRTEDT